MKTVQYEEAWGEPVFPEGFEDEIRGLPIEEQMNRYRVTEYSSYCNTEYKERTLTRWYSRLDKDSDVRGVIVRDGLVVGVLLNNDCGRDCPCLPGECVCTYYASDNDGAGYKERMDYKWLLCVPADFEK